MGGSAAGFFEDEQRNLYMGAGALAFRAAEGTQEYLESPDLLADAES